MRIYGYLRASTDEQDATRAKKELTDFAKAKGLKIAAWFIENESGASLKRPELFRLLDIAQHGDVLLVEQIDRISRLNAHDWQKLKNLINDKGLRIVCPSLPTSYQFLEGGKDDFTARMVEALNSMLLDVLAAVARQDYEDRRKRQAQGVERAKKEGKYKGRQIDKKLRSNIRHLLDAGKTYSQIVEVLGCSKSTISTVKKEMSN